MARAFWISSGLIMSNFLYQLLTSMNWATAFERSFFQLVAILCVVALPSPPKEKP